MRHGASNTQAHQARAGTATPSLDGLPPVLTASHVAELLHLNTDYVRKLPATARSRPTVSRTAGLSGSSATRSPRGCGRYPVLTGR